MQQAKADFGRAGNAANGDVCWVVSPNSDGVSEEKERTQEIEVFFRMRCVSSKVDICGYLCWPVLSYAVRSIVLSTPRGSNIILKKKTKKGLMRRRNGFSRCL